MRLQVVRIPKRSHMLGIGSWDGTRTYMLIGTVVVTFVAKKGLPLVSLTTTDRFFLLAVIENLELTKEDYCSSSSE